MTSVLPIPTSKVLPYSFCAARVNFHRKRFSAQRRPAACRGRAQGERTRHAPVAGKMRRGGPCSWRISARRPFGRAPDCVPASRVAGAPSTDRKHRLSSGDELLFFIVSVSSAGGCSLRRRKTAVVVCRVYCRLCRVSFCMMRPFRRQRRCVGLRARPAVSGFFAGRRTALHRQILRPDAVSSPEPPVSGRARRPDNGGPVFSGCGGQRGAGPA